MSEEPIQFNKFLREFLIDCTKIPERTRKGKGESDRYYMIKLLDNQFWNLAPRAEELLKALDSSVANQPKIEPNYPEGVKCSECGADADYIGKDDFFCELCGRPTNRKQKKGETP